MYNHNQNVTLLLLFTLLFFLSFLYPYLCKALSLLLFLKYISGGLKASWYCPRKSDGDIFFEPPLNVLEQVGGLCYYFWCLCFRAAKGGLEVTLMERLVKSHKDRIVRMLTMQYRMHESIMAWSSQQMYKGKLVAHSSVSSHLLR